MHSYKCDPSVPAASLGHVCDIELAVLAYTGLSPRWVWLLSITWPWERIWLIDLVYELKKREVLKEF